MTYEELQLNKLLYRSDLKVEESSVPLVQSVSVSGGSSGTTEVYSESILDGELNGDISLVGGFLQSKNFVSGSTGWRIDADGNIEANTGTFRGSISGSAIDIGGADATSFHVDTSGNMWLGASTYASATFSVSNAGSVTAATGTIAGWTLASGEFSSGSVKLQSTNERILMGSATAPLTGTGIFIGKDGSDYELRVGDPASNYLHWTGAILNIAGGVVDGTTTLNAVAVNIIQPRAEALYKNGLAVGSYDDGFTEATSNGNLTRNWIVTYFDVGSAIAVGVATLRSPNFGTGNFDLGFSFSMQLVYVANFPDSTNQNAFCGVETGALSSTDIPNDATSVVDHFGFFVDDADLYASNADGATQTRTLLTGVTLSAKNVYYIDFTSGSSVKFYVNDVLKATHTTNLPNNTATVRAYFGIESTVVNEIKDMGLFNNYFVNVAVS